MKKLKLYYILLKARWGAESPLLFKKLKKYAYSVGGSAIAIVVANSSLSLNLNSSLMNGLGYLITACVGIAGTSHLTRENNQQ